VSGLSNLLSRSGRAHAEAVHLVEPAVDLRLVARRLIPAAASEQLGHLDLQDHGHLALVDDATRLVGVGDDLEEALPRAAGLRVHVALELADVLEAATHGVHLVAIGLIASARARTARGSR